MPQQLQVRVSELRDVPHEHRQEHHAPAGRPGPRPGRWLGGGRGRWWQEAVALLARLWPLPPASVLLLRAPGVACPGPRPSPSPAGPMRGPWCPLLLLPRGRLRRVRGAGLRGGSPSDSPSPQYCVCVDDCSSSNCMCGQLSMRCWYGKVSPRAGGWGLGARVGAGQGPCPGRVGLGPGRRPQPD